MLLQVMKQNVEMRTKLQNVHRVLGAEDNLPSPPQVPSFINVNGEDNPAVTVTVSVTTTVTYYYQLFSLLFIAML